VCRATARYLNVTLAEADGYLNIGVFFQNFRPAPP
jgi:hypothetical protein